MNEKYKNGFTLLELAIVIAIIGLIAGGVVAGKGLLRAAEVRTVMTGLTTYETALNAFKEKYNELPGDMTNAERFWGSMSTGTCPNATGGLGKETCNGDGDGALEFATASNRFAELYAAWQHLANAEMIEGSFTGRAGNLSSFHSVLDVNVPRGPFPNSAYSFMRRNTVTTDSGWFYAGEYEKNFIFFGTNGINEGDVLNNPALSAKETWSIDKKMDDGKPAYGKIVVHRPNFRPDCATSDTGSLAEYQLDNEEESACTIFFMFNR